MLTRGHTSKMQLSAVLAAIAILCYNIREMRILSTLSLLTAQQNFPFHITQKFHILRGQLAFPRAFHPGALSEQEESSTVDLQRQEVPLYLYDTPGKPRTENLGTLQ